MPLPSFCPLCQENKHACADCSLLSRLSIDLEPIPPATLLQDIEQCQGAISQQEEQKANLMNMLQTRKRNLAELNERYQAYSQNKERVEQEKAELELRREDLHARIKSIEEYMQCHDTLRKEMVFVGGAKRISYQLVKSPKPKFLLIPDSGIKPEGLILVLSKKNMRNMTQHAQYYVVLDKEIQYDRFANQWKCEVPNPFRLKGSYYYLLSNFHHPNPKGISIVPQSSHVPDQLAF